MLSRNTPVQLDIDQEVQYGSQRIRWIKVKNSKSGGAALKPDNVDFKQELQKRPLYAS